MIPKLRKMTGETFLRGELVNVVNIIRVYLQCSLDSCRGSTRNVASTLVVEDSTRNVASTLVVEDSTRNVATPS